MTDDIDAFAMGNEAFYAGWTDAQCPFDMVEEEARFMEWMDGFEAARTECEDDL